MTRRRGGNLALASMVGSDKPYQALVIPEAEPVAPPAEQRPTGSEAIHLFDLLGWEWPW